MNTGIPQMETITYEQSDEGIGWLRFNRPEKLNAWTSQMWSEMGALGEALTPDPSVRAVVVAGNGRAFSSGIDTSVFGAGGINLGDGTAGMTTRHEHPTTNMIMNVASTYSWLEDAPFPTIAAVHGYAFGAGLQVALACDIRIFAHGTEVGLLEHKYGMLPDLGGTQRLPRLVGPGRAKQLIWTAARIDDDEAFRIGLCEMHVPHEELDEVAQGLAEQLASQPPLAVTGVKRAVQASMDLPIAEGKLVEALEQTKCLESQDFTEALTAFIEGRPPKYSGR